MNSKNLSEIKSRLKNVLKDKRIIDIIVFGSFVKGKPNPKDVDLAIISEHDSREEIEGFHISSIKPVNFFYHPPTIITTIIKEGYSLKENKPFAEVLRYKSKVLFVYNLTSLSNSQKVKIVNSLRGKNGQGLVEENGGEWLSNNVFLSNINSEYVFEQFFIFQKVKFKKLNVLIY